MSVSRQSRWPKMSKWATCGARARVAAGDQYISLINSEWAGLLVLLLNAWMTVP